MSFQPPKLLRKANVVFDKLCRDVHILPSDTPVFLIDTAGRIVCKRNLALSPSDFGSIYSLVNEDGAVYVQSCIPSTDAFVVESKDGKGKDYIVISKDEYGFSRCVVCSRGEKGVLRLHDFVARLCSYRDYLENFENLALSSMPKMPVKWLFGLKISGALELLDLSSKEREVERKMTFPLKAGLEKLSGLIQNIRNGETEFLLEDIDDKTFVTAPEAFFKLVVSMCALAGRFSRTGAVKLKAQRIYERDAVRITAAVVGRGDENDIFEKALVSAFEALGFLCGIRDNSDGYSIYFEVGLAKPEAVTVSDSAYALSQIDALLEDDILSALNYTISDN